jgi:hypothetical protein
MANEKLKITRTLGFEIECFVETDVDDVSINGCEVDYDGSLYGGYGESMELKTDPISDLNKLEPIYDTLNDLDLNVNRTCGLHIHVDTSDFSVEDKAKLLRFGAGIELLMYSLVEPERYYGWSEDDERRRNGYCVKLNKSWRHLFRQSYIDQNIPFDTFDDISELCGYVSRQTNKECWNGKYQWLNANVEYYPTVEFRIFSATTEHEMATKYGMLAYHIIETVKNSTIKQLQFIIKSLYQCESIEDMHSRLFDSIGLDSEFHLNTQNQELAEYIDNKFCKPVREGIEQERAV